MWEGVANNDNLTNIWYSNDNHSPKEVIDKPPNKITCADTLEGKQYCLSNSSFPVSEASKLCERNNVLLATRTSFKTDDDFKEIDKELDMGNYSKPLTIWIKITCLCWVHTHVTMFWRKFKLLTLICLETISISFPKWVTTHKPFVILDP